MQLVTAHPKPRRLNLDSLGQESVAAVSQPGALPSAAAEQRRPSSNLASATATVTLAHPSPCGSLFFSEEEGAEEDDVVYVSAERAPPPERY